MYVTLMGMADPAFLLPWILFALKAKLVLDFSLRFRMRIDI